MQKIILAIGLIALESCGDCLQNAIGVALDKESGKPIHEVRIGRVGINNTLEFETNSLGQYKVYYISGGLFKCPDLKLYFVKEGYRKAILKEARRDTVYLERLKE